MSLPESYKNFRLNYSMSKGNYSLAELLKELQAAEGILGQAKSGQVMEKGSSSYSARRIRRRKRLLNQQVSQSRRKRKVEQSPKTCASPVVKQVNERKNVPSTKLKLKTVNLQVCLFV